MHAPFFLCRLSSTHALAWLLLLLAGGPSLVSAQPAGTEQDNSDPNNAFECLGSFGGSFSKFVVKGRFAYVTGGYLLRAVDLSDPAHPRETAQMRFDGAVDTIDVYQNALYVAVRNSEEGLKIIDISDPAHPRLHATRGESSLYTTARIMGRYLLVDENAKWGESYTLYDLKKNPLKPEWITSGAHRTHYRDSFITDGETLYLSQRTGEDIKRISIIKWGAPPVTVGVFHREEDEANEFFELQGRQLVADNPGTSQTLTLQAVRGDKIWTYASHLLTEYHLQPKGDWMLVETIDRWDEATYELVSRTLVNQEPALATKTGVYALRSGCLAGNFCYVIDKGILKVSRLDGPDAPSEMKPLAEQGEMQGPIQRVGSTLYVMSDKGLMIYDTTNPDRWTLRGCYEQPASLGALKVVDGKAYIEEGGTGLLVLDVTRPQQPKVLSRTVLPKAFNILAIEENHLFAGGDKELYVVDISKATSPTLAGSCPLPSEAHAASASGNRLYVAAGSAGLQILDISQPTTPKPIGSYATQAPCTDLATSGSLVYLFAGELITVDATHPESPTLLSLFQIGPIREWSEDWGKSSEKMMMKKLGPCLYFMRTTPSETNVDTLYAVVDVANPAAPRVVASDSSESAFDEAVSPPQKGSPYAGWYLGMPYCWHSTAGDTKSMVFYDLSTPGQLKLAGRYTQLQNNNRPVLYKNRIYLVDDELVILQPRKNGRDQNTKRAKD